MENQARRNWRSDPLGIVQEIKNYHPTKFYPLRILGWILVLYKYHTQTRIRPRIRNKKDTFFWDFEIYMNPLFPARKPNLALTNKEIKNWISEGFCGLNGPQI